MIPATELYPNHGAVVREREDAEDDWGAMRIDAHRKLGERAGTAKWTVFDGWIRKLPSGLSSEQHFICVPERRIPELQLIGMLNSLNLFALFFFGLAVFALLNRSLYVLPFVALLLGYLWLIRSIAGHLDTRRLRAQERVFRSRLHAHPSWLSNQQWVAWTDSELDSTLVRWIEQRQSELVGYDVGLACSGDLAWIVVDDPDRLGPPPPLIKMQLALTERGDEEEAFDDQPSTSSTSGGETTGPLAKR